MTVAGGWLLVPLVLLLLCTGIGLLAEALARTRVPGPFVPGLGLAGLIALAGVATASGATARFAAPLCAVCAVAGFALRPPWHDARLRSAWPWAVATAVGAFALVAWPSLASGQASITGYIKLDDSAIWLGLIDQVMANGRDTADVPPSTYQLIMRFWLDTGYPVGSFTPVGVAAELTGQDIANAYQPVIAVYGAVVALGLYGCVRELVRVPSLAAACALAGVQASLLLGFAQWGAIKEVAAAALITVIAGLAADGKPRLLVLAALPAGALADAFGVGAVLWAGAGLGAGLLVLALQRPGWRRFAFTPALMVLVACAAALPALAVFGANAEQVVSGPPTAGVEELGKLFAPLNVLQGAGLWPAGDFRVAPEPATMQVLLALAGLVSALGGVVLAVRRRAWGLPVLVVAGGVAAIPGVILGAPWIDAKFLAVSAPVLLTASASLAAIGWAAPRAIARTAGTIGGVLLLAGCAASSWLIARDVYVAPRDEFTELRRLGAMLGDRGPTLLLNYEGYADRHFLRDAAPEGATDLRSNLVPDRMGRQFPAFTTAEIDAVDPRALAPYEVIVRRLTPVGSRPPTGFRPLFSGGFFEAWERVRGVQAPLVHEPLGSSLAPAGTPPCGRILALARRPRVRFVAAAPRAQPLVVELDRAMLPAGWTVDAEGHVRPDADGSARLQVTVPEAGSWRLWVGGQALGRLRASVDGRSAGAVRHQLDASVGWLRFGAARLAAGRHELRLRYDHQWWQAGRGSGGFHLPLGPVALTRDERAPAVERVPAAAAARLCDGRSYDWLEALG